MGWKRVSTGSVESVSFETVQPDPTNSKLQATSPVVTVDAQTISSLAQAATFVSGRLSASFPGNTNKLDHNW